MLFWVTRVRKREGRLERPLASRLASGQGTHHMPIHATQVKGTGIQPTRDPKVCIGKEEWAPKMSWAFWEKSSL